MLLSFFPTAFCKSVQSTEQYGFNEIAVNIWKCSHGLPASPKNLSYYAFAFKITDIQTAPNCRFIHIRAHNIHTLYTNACICLDTYIHKYTLYIDTYSYTCINAHTYGHIHDVHMCVQTCLHMYLAHAQKRNSSKLFVAWWSAPE